MEDFVEEFVCPICLTYMMPPIRQCTQGHSFCMDCFIRISRCAICRGPKTNIRCLLLERVHALVNFPCRFEDNGCDFVGKGTELITHHSICKYSTTPCPLRFENCSWRGMMSKMLDHCREEHPQNIFFKNKQKLTLSNFTEPMRRYYCIIFSVFDTLFRCHLDLSRESGDMRFAVYHIGSPLIHKRYSFEFSILSGFKNTEVFTRRGPCLQMDNNNEKFMGKIFFSAEHSLIKEFCDENGDLKFSVTVLENNADN
ncbi:hypothetical protein JTB14_003998 [Gonioctena quinquepunctata]|nr:hypothetical protein JTB14_003998 [Gonioctena quinquepunctata]